MIYRNDVLIDWSSKGEKTQDEVKVYEEITEIKNKYFSANTPQKVKLLYPKGKPTEEEIRGFAPLKMFPIPLNSANGQWRWTASRLTNRGYSDHHRYIKHSEILNENDAEFLWFLLNRSSVMNKYVFIEDLEGDAKNEVESMATDADIRFMIMGSKSPLARDEAKIRDIANIFNVKGISKMKFNQVKLALYEAILEGNQMKDKFVNSEKFEELADGEIIRKAASIARKCIEDNLVGYKDNAWWIMSGRHFEESLVKVLPKDGAFREQIFIDEVVKNPNVKDRVFSLLGEVDEITIDDLRDLDRPSLQRKYRELTGKFENSKKEEIVELLCKEYKIDYIPTEG